MDAIETTSVVDDTSGNEIAITQRGDRLKIVADVDPEGIAALCQMLADHMQRAEAQKPKRRHRRTKAA